MYLGIFPICFRKRNFWHLYLGTNQMFFAGDSIVPRFPTYMAGANLWRCHQSLCRGVQCTQLEVETPLSSTSEAPKFQQLSCQVMDKYCVGDTIQNFYYLYVEVYVDNTYQNFFRALTLFLLSKQVLWGAVW